ncbi:hypothetical protein KYB31_18940 [Clostridium felsineum]|uniref:hypothetical protein n=1 Tax=Clostridium felsineum TaxID=36839 RepID=UPI00098C19B9|nr:hypothetical protein [Clostridium felsineum]MCR3761055.1 hypothetical protein [Clostridium felsineum]URZ17162.1 hypothetical protein CLFE_032140 [Clostridium felsineum DSM 794]
MNKKIKLLSATLCTLALTLSLPLATAQASTVHSSNITTKISMPTEVVTGTLSGYATQNVPLLASPDASCKTITSWLIQGTRFVITRTDTNGWYYGAWGSDYNGWNWGWVKVGYITDITLT